MHLKKNVESISGRWTELLDNMNGRVAIPFILYLLGVPGFFVLIIWALFFRG